MDKRIIIILVVAVVLVIVGVIAFLVSTTPMPKGEQEPIAVTVVSIEEVKVILPAFVGADTAEEFPLVEMETKEGETIIGIIDIISIEEGDKIFIVENRKYGQKVYPDYEWYRFAGYQQGNEVEAQET